MDSGFNKNKTEFRILVFAVALEMLANSDGLSLSITRHHSGHIEKGS